MLRSMYSGISGIKNFQTKLDVIGNNISNVNTHGFKKGRTVFKDVVSQTIANSIAPKPAQQGTQGVGGINPMQLGLGAKIASIDTINTQGSLQSTGRSLDLSISGDGFFQVKADNGEIFYTRAGNFYLDANGTLVNNEGLKLVVANGNVNGRPNESFIPAGASNISIGKDGSINFINAGTLQSAGVIQIAKFPNADGVSKVGENLFKETPNSGVPVSGGPGANGTGSIAVGTLEMSNVDLSEEFTEMIVAQRGFQANTRIVTTADEILQELMSLKR